MLVCITCNLLTDCQDRGALTLGQLRLKQNCLEFRICLRLIFYVWCFFSPTVQYSCSALMCLQQELPALHHTSFFSFGETFSTKQAKFHGFHSIVRLLGASHH